MSGASRPLRATVWRGGARGRLAGIAFLALICSFPLAYMLSLSFSRLGGVLAPGLSVLPQHPTFGNYISAWTENDFSGYFVNSVFVAAGTVLGTLVLSSLTAYGFARYQFRGRETLFYLMLASLAVPATLLVLPQYVLMRDLGLLDSRLGLVMLYISANLPFSVFLLRGFFEGIPRELTAAMRLDGVSELGILIKLVMPLSRAALATVGLFTFNGAWDEFVLALTMINTPSKRTMPIAIALFQQTHSSAWGPFFAASVIATAPTVIAFAVAQRWFQQGLSLGALQ
ncbi:MAG TPA: carbohydrate ABC transporter permease [Streptosporangiaceae bacterium]|nr:carbohydrate ABC transporter permease [Streptosporangiaceae bacterium]